MQVDFGRDRLQPDRFRRCPFGTTPVTDCRRSFFDPRVFCCRPVFRPGRGFGSGMGDENMNFGNNDEA